MYFFFLYTCIFRNGCVRPKCYGNWQNYDDVIEFKWCGNLMLIDLLIFFFRVNTYFLTDLQGDPRPTYHTSVWFLKFEGEGTASWIWCKQHLRSHILPQFSTIPKLLMLTLKATPNPSTFIRSSFSSETQPINLRWRYEKICFQRSSQSTTAT